jgi:hypothetical protein
MADFASIQALRDFSGADMPWLFNYGHLRQYVYQPQSSHTALVHRSRFPLSTHAESQVKHLAAPRHRPWRSG